MDLRQFATFEENYGDACDIEIACKFTFSYNFEHNIVCCTNSVVFSTAEKTLLKAELDAFFSMNPASVDDLSENECIVIPNDLQAQFASLTYGSMRGIIFAKTIGTPLNHIILPPNDVLSAIQSPIRFTP